MSPHGVVRPFQIPTGADYNPDDGDDAATVTWTVGPRELNETNTGHAAPGLCRNDELVVAHLYSIPDQGSGEFGWPYCARGWNRSGGSAYSILRRNIGVRGICRVCQRRFKSGLAPVPPTPRWTRWI